MIIIVDGYNLLKQLFPAALVSERERHTFIMYMRSYARKKEHEIVIVFDGGPYTWPTKEDHSGIRVVYSGVHESADDYIKYYIDRHTNQDLLLVSSDRELCVHADKRGIASINSLDFYHIIRTTMQESGAAYERSADQARKLSDEDNAELDAIMHEASSKVMHKKDDAKDYADKELLSKTRSKNERQLVKKLKKL